MKDFEKWHHLKCSIDADGRRSIFFYEREVWWCSIGENIGDEENGKGNELRRPILVFRKFNAHVLWGIPITTKRKSGIFYAPITLADNLTRIAILSQMRLLDEKRLIRNMGMISMIEYEAIQKSVMALCKP